jgi:lipopolysaccharide biosynthesis glycosyltransferase
MKNCVFYCVYGDQEYLKLLNISLLSLNKLSPETDILVFSDRPLPNFERIAKVIVIEFPQGYAIPMAYRLLLGKNLLEEYDNILHLDIDTVVNGNLDILFESNSDNKISFATENEENPTSCVGEYWAGPLLTPSEFDKYKNVNSICAGVFGFNKSMYSFLDKIYEYVVQVEWSGYNGPCRDQHAFCAYVLRNNLYNFNLQKYVCHSSQKIFRTNESVFNSNFIVYHFAGGVTTRNKFDVMKKALDTFSLIN